MKRTFLAAVLVLLAAPACAPESGPGVETASGADPAEVTRWEARAERVEIIRDDWGVPHIYGPTDADAVFGLMYAQAEDDFPRIERNFLFSQGRLAEAFGEEELWTDLRMRLFIDPEEMQALYADSPGWLQELMDGWADGLNYYLHTHPEVEPMVLDRFEPWMALSFSEGSIGGDIERVNTSELEAFYENPDARMQAVQPADPVLDTPAHAPVELVAAGAGVTSSLVEPDPHAEPTGSNGIAIEPELTENGHALLLINPHTSFFFRHEAHVVSDEGLNAYGALTWGQFFIYQGFNETAGWMHTSSGVDNIDEFLETVVERDGELFYVYGDEERSLETQEVTVRYRTGDGGMDERSFTTYRTHRGPIVRAVDGRWVSAALMEEPRDALIQSYVRTKAADLDAFLEAMESHTNSSNNTVFADASGNIAYLHSNFIPIRDTRFDYLQPVDGSDPASDWQGVHTVEETPNAVNPSVGWVQNTNNWPYSAAGPASPDPDDYPVYMERDRAENARGEHALMLLTDSDGWTLDGLVEAAYDPYMPWFEGVVPALVADWQALPDGDPLRADLEEPVGLLAGWDLRWGVASVPTSVAVFWGTELQRSAEPPQGMSEDAWLESADARAFRLESMVTALERLENDFGDWRTPWGEINRFQRLTGDIEQDFDDDAPSTPVGFVSGRWGSLASFGARAYPGTSRWYGTSGNSFVAVVEFGDSVQARAVTAGGLSNQPSSPHFNDQAERYANGNLRDVYFYRDEVEGAAQRTYRPGG